MVHHSANAHLKMQPVVKNAILARMPLQDLAAIGAVLEPVILQERMVLQEPKGELEHVYFIESGLISLRIVAEASILETALIGYRGAVGASILLGGHVSTHQHVVLFRGTAYRTRVEDLRRLTNERQDIAAPLLRYVQALNLHCAQTGLCGVRHETEGRLASWLCLAMDAIASRALPVTHDYLSTVLGLRRAGVTETLIRFEEQGLIRKTRGLLEVDDRAGLQQKACCCYRFISAAYACSEAATSTQQG
ncbi:Crp/Fnr family transcriptional regulator [Bradyrhizobium sp. BEA-2-5]|uniref:Crp/Fnr family transcriptional regulator n=1 Tax=Bradyrhizobium sp. BEA-2-5 TaxID=3080015 RepID=UPI00293F48FC|nr:Crp/Fnr family transcriptional regulator [Bradyrhizobium sp. BEA-2-5]WOH80322.1 Crp/Fnr family transcriptional regulator [Bradyrhizobium sp. BEA-2-5]